MTPAPDQQDPPLVRQSLADIEAALRRHGFLDAQLAETLPDIRKTLIETAQAPPEPAEGGPRVIIGERFYGLKDMGGQVIESGVKLALSAILAGHGSIDPTHAKQAVVDCLMGIRKTVLKLDDAEKLVCVAIMDISSKKRSRIFIEPGASAADIRAYFEQHRETSPPELDKMLGELSRGEPKVLEAATYGDRGPFYQVRF